MKFLDKITSPQDLKKLNLNSLEFLCGEIRRFLIDTISVTGGHLASNLGVVELTVALHYCFNTPGDSIVWDVGHQAYVHKMLTGRLNRFTTLRQLGGLSGFPKFAESPHDAFDTGHSATSVSAALGLALSRDLAGRDNNVLAVIGDGAMTGGLAFEALNNAGRANTRLMVVLNDNQMSISENVGAISRHLNDIRTAPTYLSAKADVNNFLKNVPMVGGGLSLALQKAKDTLKYLLVPGDFFEALGFKYVGPIDGHDLAELIRVIANAQKINKPVLLHVYTTKGKGYNQAEQAPAKFHGVDSFHVDTGLPTETKIWGSWSDVFGKELLRQAKRNEKIVAVTAAMPDGTGLAPFQKEFPNRMFDVGIAECHAVTFSAGLAKSGHIPVFAVYSTFLQRAYDQILHDVCLQNLHVVFAVDRAGIVGHDGETHQGLYDISFLSHMPNMTVMAPKNKRELKQMLAYAINHSGPVAVRYPRGAASGVLKEVDAPLEHGRCEAIAQGEDALIVSVGAMMDAAWGAYQRLVRDSRRPALLNARFIKPIDPALAASLGNYSHVYTLEDNAASGGFGAALLALAADMGVAVKHFHRFAFPDAFIPHGSPRELYARYGLDEDGVYNKIKADLEKEDSEKEVHNEKAPKMEDFGQYEYEIREYLR